MATAKVRKNKIQINPREPLTKKAAAAIVVYVRCQGDKYGRFEHVLVNATLKAERMKREKLYEYLEGRGYRWNPRVGWRIKQ